MNTLLYCGIVPFASIRQRPQWLALELCSHFRVLYLNPHFSKQRSQGGPAHVERCSENLAVVHPSTAWPFSGYWGVINRINYARVWRQVEAALTELGWQQPAGVWTSFPKHLALLRHLPKTLPVCYDVMDDYAAFFDRWQGHVLTGMHRLLLERSQVVIASSRELQQRCQAVVPSAKPHVIENAITNDFVARCREAEPALATRDLKRPVFGYIGAIAHWFDYQAVIALAEAFPEGHVVLVGPVEGQVPMLPANVQLLGARPHAELPGYLKTFDVALVPFVVSKAIDAVNPVKVYEYLAARLPVLGSDFTELRRFGSAVTICRQGQWADEARRVLSTKPSLADDVPLPTWGERAVAVRHALVAHGFAS